MEDVVCGHNGNVILDKQMNGGVRGAKDELGNLHRGQSTLQSVGYANVDRREGEVSVLWCLSASHFSTGSLPTYHQSVDE
jgi:hypothetical protein